MPFANPQYAEGRFEEKVGNQSKDYHSMNSYHRGDSVLEQI